MKLLEGKTALITGAARGIGKAIALKFASEGANIAFTDIVIDENGKATEAEIAAFGVKAKGYASDASNFEATKEVVEQIKSSHNIHIHLDLIAGLPYEDYESFRNSFNEVYSLQPQQLQLGFLKVLKGSYMHEKVPDYQLQYMDTPPYEVLCTKWLSYEKLLHLKKVEEMVELYYNMSIIPI